ncbi:MAG: tetratricopeptide repeat protein [Bacillota bacterium]
MKILEEIFNDAYKCFVQKRYSDCVLNLRRSEQYAESLDPNFLVVAENLKGMSFLGLGEINLAREAFEKALKTDPASSQACAGLGEIFFLNKQDVQAKTMFEYAVQNNPENQIAVNGLAKVNELLNLPADHNSLISETKFKNPDFRNVVIESSELFSKGQFEEAIVGINSIEEKLENDLLDLRDLLTEMLNMKAAAYLNLNDFEQARLSFEKALNISPDSSTACWGLGEIFYRTNMLTEAKTMYEWALKHDDSNIAAQEGILKVERSMNPSENANSNNRPALKLASGKIIEID